MFRPHPQIQGEVRGLGGYVGWLVPLFGEYLQAKYYVRYAGTFKNKYTGPLSRLYSSIKAVFSHGFHHLDPSNNLENARNRMAPRQNGDGQASVKRQLALSWCEDDIISVYQQAAGMKPNGCAVTGFHFPPDQPVAYVKFGLKSRRMTEVKNHEYAFAALKAMPPHQTKGILVPEIYRTFESNNKFFIVMEYIPGRLLARYEEGHDWESQQETVINSIAGAIKLLMSIPAPPGQKPGPVGGGRIRHPLFKDDESYCEYSSVEELESHLNRVCDHRDPPTFGVGCCCTIADTIVAQVSTIRNKTAPTVTLERDLCFYFSDFYPSNFIFTDAGDICVIDFEQAGFLPLSFMSFAVAQSRWGPGLWIRDRLKLPEHNLDAMKNIFYWFAIAVPWLGESPRKSPFY